MRSWILLLALAALSLAAAPASAATRGIEVSPRPGSAPPAGPRDRALVIGIDAYERGWPRLDNAVNDARFVAAALSRRGFDVRLETDLSGAELERAFEDFFLFAGEDPDTRLLVWFAGHGHSDGGEAYLVPADAPRPEAGAAFRHKALSLRRFGEYMRIAQSRQALAVFDSCFSGTIFEIASTPGGFGAAERTLPARQFITSGAAGQEVADDGTFRRLFLRALEGAVPADGDRDGWLTGSELGNYLSRRLTYLSGGRQTPQFGKLRDRAYAQGEFAFALTAAAPPVAVAPPPPQPDPEVRRVQRDLAALGYRPGPQDGLLGPRTQAAIRAYQADRGLPVDGRVGVGLLASLEENLALAAAPAPAGETIYLDHRSRVAGVPPAYIPAPGYCRVWHRGRPPGHQPPPFHCAREPAEPAISTVVYHQPRQPQPRPRQSGAEGNKGIVGTLLGAAIGGLAGSRIGDGRGRLIATAAGTFLGAVVGNQIGRSMDEVDREKARRATATAARGPLGETIVWNNPRTGNHGTVTAVREGATRSGRVCREFQQTVVIGGRQEEASGTACRQPDGSWILAGK